MAENEPPSVEKEGAALIGHLPTRLRPWAAAFLIVAVIVVAWRWSEKKSEPVVQVPVAAPTVQNNGTNNGIMGPVSAATINLVTTPAPVSSSVRVEPLRPGHEPTPENGCSGPDFDKDPSIIRIIFGQAAFAKSGYGRYTPLTVGSCPVLSAERTPDGVNFAADLYDFQDNLIATFHDNIVEAVSGGGRFHVERNSVNAIAVRDDQNRELLYIRYFNPAAIGIRGRFGCKGFMPVIVDDTGIHGGASDIQWRRTCITLAGGIHVSAPSR